MAINTINEKFALITQYQPWNTPVPISVDGLDQADNQHLIWDYPGLLWTTLAAPKPFAFIRVFRTRRR